MNSGQIGCFLSHREAWKKCVANQKPMLVLEDDFLFHKGLSELLPIVFDSLPHFGLLRLQGLKANSKYKVLKDYGESKLVEYYHDTFGTTAYFIKPESAEVLLEKSSRFSCHVDDFLGHDWIHRVKILSILPYPVIPNGMTSTIGCDNQETCRLTKTQKWLTKIMKLRRSIAKRAYRMRTFPQLFFTDLNRAAK
jgi:glycosyl transferase family 25